MRTISKFKASGIFKLSFNDHAPQVLHFGEQDGELFVWVDHSNYAPQKYTFTFCIYPTGAKIDPESVHIQSVVCKDGTVWHLYQY